ALAGVVTGRFIFLTRSNLIASCEDSPTARARAVTACSLACVTEQSKPRFRATRCGPGRPARRLVAAPPRCAFAQFTEETGAVGAARRNGHRGWSWPVHVRLLPDRDFGFLSTNPGEG